VLPSSFRAFVLQARVQQQQQDIADMTFLQTCLHLQKHPSMLCHCMRLGAVYAAPTPTSAFVQCLHVRMKHVAAAVQCQITFAAAAAAAVYAVAPAGGLVWGSSTSWTTTAACLL
jgi:hypothetical protein